MDCFMIRMTHLLLSADEDEGLPAYLSETYMPLLRELPGAERVEAAVVTGRTLGEIPVRAIVDVYFSDEDAMNSAFASAEGRKVSREIMGGRGANMDILTSTVLI